MSEIPKGWDIVESKGEDSAKEPELSPEERARQEREARRRSVLESLEEVVELGEASEEVVYYLSRSSVSEKDFAQFVSRLHKLAAETAPRKIDWTTVNLLKAAESLEQIELFEWLAGEWKARFVSETTSKEEYNALLVELERVIQQVTGCNIYPRPHKSTELMRGFFENYMDLYEFARSFPSGHPNTQKQPSEVFGYLQDSPIDNFVGGGLHKALYFNEPGQLRAFLDIFEKTADFPNKEALAIFSSAIVDYGRIHRVERDSIKGFVGKLLPAINEKNPEVEILSRRTNSWGMEKGTFGIADFVVHSYGIPCDPLHVNELILASREAPTSSASRFEQNRKDALKLASPFGVLRDFIHDQQPHVHELLGAMLHFYDTGDTSKVKEVLPYAKYFNTDERKEALVDKSKYTEGVVETLRRLFENTQPVQDIPPRVKDEYVDGEVENLRHVLYAGDSVSREALGNVLVIVSSKLKKLANAQEVGMEPNFAILLSWLERQSFRLLQGLSFEDQMAAYKQRWFKDVLEFNELTASARAFDQSEFDSFMSEIVLLSFEEAYKRIGNRTLRNVSELAQIYKKNGKEDTGALWSGNISHELMTFVNPRTALSEQGRKAALEVEKRVFDPDYHPGD